MVDNKILKALGLVKIDIKGKNLESQRIEIIYKVDKLIDEWLSDLRDKAIHGKAEDIFRYNMAIDKSPKVRKILKEKFIGIVESEELVPVWVS